MDLEFYKALRDYLNDYIQHHNGETYHIVINDVLETIQFEYQGKVYDLNNGWEDEIHRFDADKPQFWFWQAEPNDEYAVFVHGYYDSWGGSEVESYLFSVGRITKIVRTYMGFEEVK